MFPNYSKILFDYDTTRKNVIPQLDYIGSQYLQDYYNQNIIKEKSLVNIETQKERNTNWMISDTNENRYLNT